MLKKKSPNYQQPKRFQIGHCEYGVTEKYRLGDPNMHYMVLGEISI